MKKQDLKRLIVEALESTPTRGAKIVDISKHIWENHKNELERSGDLFYTWQYDMRWAGYKLRGEGKIKGTNDSPNGIWQLT